MATAELEKVGRKIGSLEQEIIIAERVKQRAEEEYRLATSDLTHATDKVEKLKADLATAKAQNEELLKGLEVDYQCKTCNKPVMKGEHHPHGCPVEEGDSCADRRCNESGRCQG